MTLRIPNRQMASHSWSHYSGIRPFLHLTCSLISSAAALPLCCRHGPAHCSLTVPDWLKYGDFALSIPSACNNTSTQISTWLISLPLLDLFSDVTLSTRCSLVSLVTTVYTLFGIPHLPSHLLTSFQNVSFPSAEIVVFSSVSSGPGIIPDIETLFSICSKNEWCLLHRAVEIQLNYRSTTYSLLPVLINKYLLDTAISSYLLCIVCGCFCI